VHETLTEVIVDAPHSTFEVHELAQDADELGTETQEAPWHVLWLPAMTGYEQTPAVHTAFVQELPPVQSAAVEHPLGAVTLIVPVFDFDGSATLTACTTAVVGAPGA
jgi:hypothetical protein